MIRKVTIDYNSNGVICYTHAYYTGGGKTKFFDENANLPKTVVRFIATASECKTYYSSTGNRTDVYTA